MVLPVEEKRPDGAAILDGVQVIAEARLALEGTQPVLREGSLSRTVVLVRGTVSPRVEFRGVMDLLG